MKISPVKFWYLAVIVGIAILASTFAAMSLIIANAQQAKRLTPVEKDDIREAVFRHQFYHNASGQQQRAKAFFLSIEEGDPDDAFIERLKDNQPPVKKDSQVKTEGLFDKDGFKGLIFRIDSIKQISPDEVEVEGGYYENGLSASGNVYTVRRIKDKWTVTGDKMLWIS